MHRARALPRRGSVVEYSVPSEDLKSLLKGYGVSSEATARFCEEDEGISEHPQGNGPFGILEQDRRAG